MAWKEFQGGTPLCGHDAEGVTIVLDEDHVGGARITLVKGSGPIPFAINCGICGCFVHTAYASTRAEAEGRFRDMRDGLDAILASMATIDPAGADRRMPDVDRRITEIVDRFG